MTGFLDGFRGLLLRGVKSTPIPGEKVEWVSGLSGRWDVPNWGENPLGLPRDAVRDAINNLLTEQDGRFTDTLVKRLFGVEKSSSDVEELRLYRINEGGFEAITLGVLSVDGRCEEFILGCARNMEVANEVVKNNYANLRYYYSERGYERFRRCLPEPYAEGRGRFKTRECSGRLHIQAVEYLKGFNELYMWNPKSKKRYKFTLHRTVEDASRQCRLIEIPLKDARTSTLIMEEIAKVITLGYSEQKKEMVGCVDPGAGDFVFNPETGEVKVVAVRERLCRVLTCEFIYRLLNTYKLGWDLEGQKSIPLEGWNLFKPEDALKGLGKALIELFGFREGIKKTRLWLSDYVRASERNRISKLHYTPLYDCFAPEEFVCDERHPSNFTGEVRRFLEQDLEEVFS